MIPELPAVNVPTMLSTPTRTFARRFVHSSNRHPISAARCVSTSTGIRNWELNDDQLKSIRVNQTRLSEELHYTCRWGTGQRWGKAESETGMSRLSLSDADKHARDWFVDTTKSLGCNVTVDAMGNIFAIRKGREDAPPTCAGSHLDTQPSGGRYDGVLGVLAGVEMLKVLAENRIETACPVGVVNWTK